MPRHDYKNKKSEEDIEDVKRVRHHFRMPWLEKEKIKRECLFCGKEFMAEGKYHRLCCSPSRGILGI
jgi:hypothetical protein